MRFYFIARISLLALVAIILIGLMFASPANAADAKGAFVIIGNGKNSCGDYIAARREPNSGEAVGYSLWLTGFLTSVNDDWANTYSISGNIDISVLMRWLDNYCAANQTQSFTFAAKNLVVFLYPNRIQNEPK